MTIVRDIFSGMLNRLPGVQQVSTRTEEIVLPKLIHQTFPTTTLPPEVRQNVDALRSMNPDWEHRLYDDAQIISFIRDHYGRTVVELFERIDPTYGAARADLFRYLLLYEKGGVYLDIKSAATRPLNDVLKPDDRFLLSQWPTGHEAKFEGAGWHEETRNIEGGEFQQWFVVATAGHPFLKAVIETVLRNIKMYNPALHGVGKPGVLRLTGPIAYTLAISAKLGQHPHRFVDAEGDLGFHYSIYPMVNKADMQHVRLFKTHYSQSKSSVVRLTGANALVTPPLLFLANVAKKLRANGPGPH